jgi:oxygen-independent coproporphyrinogen-3 oxidase
VRPKKAGTLKNHQKSSKMENPIVTRGIYIHIPFCRSKCNYCHFVSLSMQRSDADRYKRAVAREIEIFTVAHRPVEEVDSIYFGGGTPSLLPAAHIAGLLSSCRTWFAVAEDCEISLEANPGTLPAGKVKLRKSGVNRISLGAQTFDNRELASIGRRHTSDEILESLRLLREHGFIEVNLDLMLGLPLQTAESWRRNLEIVAGLDVPHISVYMLDVDDPCPLRSLVENGSVRLPEEDLVSDLYLETIDRLSSCGYAQYEISNFAQPGHSCRHNLKYWTRAPVQGFGLASHSFDGHSRQANFSQMDAYLASVEAGRLPVSRREPLTEAQALEETFFLGLRLNGGLGWDRLKAVYGGHSLQKYEKSLRELCDKGLVEWKDSTVRLTPLGMLLSNEVFQLFV